MPATFLILKRVQDTPERSVVPVPLLSFAPVALAEQPQGLLIEYTSVDYA